MLTILSRPATGSDEYLAKREVSVDLINQASEITNVPVRYNTFDNINQDDISNSSAVMFRWLGRSYDINRVINTIRDINPNVQIWDEYLLHLPRVRSKIELIKLNPSYPTVYETIKAHQLPTLLDNYQTPFIVKGSKHGRQGKLTFKVKSDVSLDRAIRGFEDYNADIIVEQYIKSRDIRIMVFKGEVITNNNNVFRRGNKNKIRRSSSQGPSELYRLPDPIRPWARHIYRTTGLTFYSADVLMDSQGRPRFVDINQSPSFATYSRLVVNPFITILDSLKDNNQ